ncbi:RNA polymerase sigma factor [Methylomonas sp. TEB]|uniref:RNA polymerase sigma factor n=1 Tax=Methylomonas sp. TEB TaxID=3398229 RepID=UPI0039F57772
MTAVSDTLDHFFRENRDDLIGFFLRRLHCPDTAKDLAQETFVRLLFSEQRTPTQDRRALAFFIAGNLVVDHIRKESVRARYAPSQEIPAELLEAVAGNDPDAEKQLMAWQDLDTVNTALNELPEECRVAFYLSAIEGLTYAQIGECLGVSERAIAKRIAKTLKHCRDRREQR